MNAAAEIIVPPLDIVPWTEGAPIERGHIYSGLPGALYHGGPGISNSGLKRIRQSPAHYWTERQNPRPQTAAMLLGTALHALVLEPDTFAEQFVTLPPGAPRRPTSRQRLAKRPSPDTVAACAWWDAWEADNAGKTIIPNENDDDRGVWGRDTWDTIHYMRDAIMAHPTASILLSPDDCITELSVYWVDQAEHKLCKCRPDAYNMAHDLLIDLKSTTDASYSGFARACAEYDYHAQDAFYRDGMRAVGRPVQGFIFVAAEKEPPYGVGVYQITRDGRELGREMYRRALRVYARCMESGEWPCYGWQEQDAFGIRDLELPGYAKRVDIS